MMMNPQLHSLALLLVLAGFITACGGGDSTTTKPSVEREEEIQKASPLEKCSVTVTGEDSGVKFKIISESDYDGDIKFNCSRDAEKEPTAQQYFLINGVPSLNIVKLQRVTQIISDCKLGNTSFKDSLTVSFNYNSGEVKTSIDSSAKGKSSCTSKYKSPIETTIGSQKSIKTLFDYWGIDVSEANKDKTGLISTDCPQTAPTQENSTSEVPVCNIVISNKYTITDDSGKIHKLEKKVSY